jgi:hypothetical protein
MPEDATRDRLLRKKYGITLAEYDAVLQAQGGVCAVCGKPPRTRRLAVDHCHRRAGGRKVQGAAVRQSVRAIVCSFPCNYVLLRANMSADALEGAARILRGAWPAQSVLG